MIRRPSYREFLDQTKQSSHKTLHPIQNIPSHQRPPLSPHHSKRTTLPENTIKEYSNKNSSVAQNLLKIPYKSSSIRQTQGYTCVASDKKQNSESSFHYTPYSNSPKSPIKSSKTSQWKPGWKQYTSFNDNEIKKEPQTASKESERTMHQNFMKTALSLTHTRSKATVNAPIEQYFTESRGFSSNSSNGMSKFQITDKICSKNEIKKKACISTAVLPMTQTNKSRSTTPVNFSSSPTQNILSPIQFRKKPSSGLQKPKQNIDLLYKSASKSNIRTCYKIEPTMTQSMKPKMCLKDFLIGKKLGEGRFGSVYMVIHRQTGAIFALKKVPKSVLKEHMMIDQFSLEVKIQAAVSHPNLVSVYALFDQKNYVYLLLQYLSGGSLYGQLKKKGKFNEEEAAFRTKALCKAVQALNQQGIAHRDIKPQNIMICEEVCKLGDFGWATICDERRKTYCGTTDYVSPEIVEGKQYGPRVDMWCVGVLAYELITGRPPFYHLSKQQTFRRIEKATPTFPNSMSMEAIDFISKLLRKVPEQRMSASEALSHPFILKRQGKK